METLNTRVNEYFGKRKRTGDWQLYVKAAIILVLFVLIYSTIVFVHAPPGSLWYVVWIYAIVRVLLCVVLGTLAAAIGFNIMHDAGHGSLSQKKWVNTMWGYTLNMLGGNIFFWLIKHNIIHHTYTNINGHDDDINVEPIMRMHPDQPLHPLHHYQQWYALPLYGLGYGYWIWFQDWKKLLTKKIGRKEIKSIPTVEYFIFFLSKIVHVSIFILVPYFFGGFSFVQVLCGYLVFVCSCGIVISVVFQLAHAVEKTHMISVPEDYLIPESFALHQIRTTADFAPDNKLISWLVGGLNFQVEHHLFPKISHVHYPAIQKIVEKTCAELGVQYNVYDTALEAIGSHFKFLKTMGSPA